MILHVHVGGNDADDGKDLVDFCDDYISLSESLAQEDRRIIVSGLLRRQCANLEPFNEQLKSLCEENDIEFINNFDNFMYASGELPKTYFKKDKIHLNYNGTMKLLSNIDNSIKVTNQDFNIKHRHLENISKLLDTGQAHELAGDLVQTLNCVLFSLNVAIVHKNVILKEGLLVSRIILLGRQSQGV